MFKQDGWGRAAGGKEICTSGRDVPKFSALFQSRSYTFYIISGEITMLALPVAGVVENSLMGIARTFYFSVKSQAYTHILQDPSPKLLQHLGTIKIGTGNGGAGQRFIR